MKQVTSFHTRSLLTGALAAAVAAATWAAPARAADGSFDRTLKVSGPVSLDVRTGSGNIRVHRGESSTVVIHAEIRSGHGDWGSSDAESRIREIEKNPPIEQDGSAIRIGQTHDSELYRNISISYEISAPGQTHLEAQTGSGDLTVAGVELDVTGRTGSGSIRVEDTGGRTELNAGSGDVHLRNARGGARISSGSGNVTAEGVAGAITASSGSGTVRLELTGAGDVEASSGSGNIILRGANGAVRAHTGSGDVEAHGQQHGDWHLRTGSGNVTVELPPGAGFELDAHSGSGTIQTEREIAVVGTLSHRDVHGKAGGGGPLLELRTSSGNIYLR
jgi:Putative adhesin